MSTCQEYLATKHIRSYQGLWGYKAFSQFVGVFSGLHGPFVALLQVDSHALVSIFFTSLTMKSAVRNSAKLCREAMGDEGGWGLF